jgi:glutaredoxin 3
MKKVEIYTRRFCSDSHRAKQLLRRKGADFIEYDITDDPAAEQEMRERSRRQSVPEIFIDDALVGGCDNLLALERHGSLDRMLDGHPGVFMT